MMNHIQKITMTRGTPRKNSTYTVAGKRIQRWGASRAMPMKMPRMKPRMMDGTASRRVPPTKLPMPRKPCSSRNGRLRQMTSRSSMALAPPPPAARDEAGDGGAALHPGHERRDGDAEDQVDDGARGESLDRLRGVGLDLAGLERELGHADGERDRRVLEQVERLVGPGRDDEAQGHRQDHVAVRLERGEARRHRRLELGARDGLDAGAQHLGEARPAV